MPQIKITITDEQKAKLERYAKQCGISLSQAARDRLESAEHGFTEPSVPIRNGETTKITAELPKELAVSIKENAAELGMTPSMYLYYVLSQKGKPVIVQYDYLANLTVMQDIAKIVESLAAIADAARQDGSLYANDLARALAQVRMLKMQMTAVINLYGKQSMDAERVIQKQLMNDVRNAKGVNTNGSDKDDSGA